MFDLNVVLKVLIQCLKHLYCKYLLYNPYYLISSPTSSRNLCFAFYDLSIWIFVSVLSDPTNRKTPSLSINYSIWLYHIMPLPSLSTILTASWILASLPTDYLNLSRTNKKIILSLHAKSRSLAVVLADFETRLSDKAFLTTSVGLLTFLCNDDLVTPYTQKLLLIVTVVVGRITLLFQVVNAILFNIACVAMLSKLRRRIRVIRIVKLMLLLMRVCIIVKWVIEGFIVETLRMSNLFRLSFIHIRVIWMAV